MSSRVASPDDKIDLVFEMVVEPLKRCIDEGEWRITIGRLGAEDACRAGITMACRLCRCGGEGFVESIWMKIWRFQSAGSGIYFGLIYVPVM